MPLGDRLFGKARISLVSRIRPNLHPRSFRVEQEMCPLGRDWKRSVDRRRQRVNQLGPPRIPQPEMASAEPTEVAPPGTLVGTRLSRTLNHRLVDPQVLSALDRERLVRTAKI